MIQEHAESAVATVGRHVQGRIVVADAEALRASVAVGAVDRWFSECGGLGVWEMDGDVEGFARELHTALQPLCMTGEMRGGAKLTFLMHDTGMVAVRTTRQLLAALERISHTALPTPHYVAVGPTPLSDIPSEHIPLTYVPMVDGTCYHLNLPDVMPFADSEPVHDSVPLATPASYSDAASRLASLCLHSLGQDLTTVWCIGDSSKSLGRLTVRAAGALKGSTNTTAHRKAGLLLVDRTLDLRAPFCTEDALLNAVLGSDHTASYEAIAGLLTDMQALKGMVIERLASVAAHDPQVEQLLQRGISSTERLFALYSRIVSSDKCSLTSAHNESEADRHLTSLIHCLAGAEAALHFAHTSPPPPHDSMESSLRSALRNMKDALRGNSTPSQGSNSPGELRQKLSETLEQMSSQMTPLEAAVESLKALCVAYSVHAVTETETVGVSGTELYTPEVEVEMLLLEFEAVLAKVLLKAVEEGEDEGRVRGALGQALCDAMYSDDERGAAVEAASRRVMSGAARLADIRRASGVLSADLANLKGEGKGGFLTTVACHATKDPGLLLTDAEKMLVDEVRPAEPQSQAMGWLGSLGTALLGDAPDEDLQAIVVCVLGGISPVEARAVVQAVQTQSGGRIKEVVVGGTSCLHASNVFDSLMGTA